MSEAATGQAERSGLALSAASPAVVAIMIIDLLALLGRWSGISGSGVLHVGLLLASPWMALAWTGSSPAALGYNRRHLLLHLGWGAVAGSLWRLASLLFNLLVLGWRPAETEAWAWVSALVWVPFLEETFFRGYLGRSLMLHIGAWPGILVQAVLFTFQPYHLGQGWPGLIGIFGFGLLAGWLVHKRASIWPAWGAHAMANVLVIPLSAFA